MAKAQLKLINTADPQDWLAGVLRERFVEILKHREAALDPDQIEGVHDVRVAIRRLRSAIRDSSQISDGSPLQDIRKNLKRLANKLGAVRDRDVFVEAIEKRSAKTDDPDILEGLNTLVIPEREKRAAAFGRVEKKFSEKYVADLKDRFDKALDTSLNHPDHFQASSVREAGNSTISTCVVRFLRLSDAFYDPFAKKRLHRLRIRGKRLRYTLELFQEPFGEELEPFVEEMRDMQSHLGDLHDCNLWMAKLQRRINRGKYPTGSPQHEATVWLLSQFLRRRAKAHAGALDLWSIWEKRSFVSELEQLISHEHNKKQAPE